MNLEANDDLLAKSIFSIAKECVGFGTKNIFISRLRVSTLHNLAFISALTKALKAKCLMHNFHFVNNWSIKKEHLRKDSLHLNRSGKDLLINNTLQGINNFLRNLRDQ